MRPITEGDTVVLNFTNNEPFGTCHLKAVITSMPADTGDLIYADADYIVGTPRIQHIAVNPNCAEFAGMTRLEAPHD